MYSVPQFYWEKLFFYRFCQSKFVVEHKDCYAWSEKRFCITLILPRQLGADKFPVRILKASCEELSTPLTLLFNGSFSLWRVPLQWKFAIISPVYKANERDLVENYVQIYFALVQSRKVSGTYSPHSNLLSCLCIPVWLTAWFRQTGREIPATQIILTRHKRAKALDEGRQVDVLFLDFNFQRPLTVFLFGVLLDKLSNLEFLDVCWIGAKTMLATKSSYWGCT